MLIITMAAFFRVPLLPSIGADLSMSAAQLGLLTTVFALGRLVADIPAGWFADRIRPSRMMAISALVVGAGGAVLGGSQTAGVALVAAFLLGVGSATTNTTGMTFFSHAAPASRRGTALSAFSAALLAGQAFGPTVGGVVAGFGTWRSAMGVSAAICAVTAAGLGTSRSEVGAAPGRSARTSRHAPFAPLPVRVVLYGVPFAVFGALGSMTQTLVPIIGDAALGLSASTMGLALGLGGLARLGGALVGGQLADRFSRKAALVPGLLVQAVGVALLAAGSTTAVWVASIVVMSLASYGIGVAGTMIADLSTSAGVGVGKSLGIFRFVGDVGLIAAPVITALIYERLGTAPAVLPVAALLAGVGIACSLVLPETRWLEDEAAQR